MNALINYLAEQALELGEELYYDDLDAGYEDEQVNDNWSE